MSRLAMLGRLALRSRRRRIRPMRKVCGCIVSRDIGMYESCLFGCDCVA